MGNEFVCGRPWSPPQWQNPGYARLRTRSRHARSSQRTSSSGRAGSLRYAEQSLLREGGWSRTPRSRPIRTDAARTSRLQKVNRSHYEDFHITSLSQISGSADQRRRRTAARPAATAGTRSRVASSRCRIRSPATRRRNTDPNPSANRAWRGDSRGRAARGSPTTGRACRRCARASDSAGRRGVRPSRYGSARRPLSIARPRAPFPWPR